MQSIEIIREITGVDPRNPRAGRQLAAAITLEWLAGAPDRRIAAELGMTERAVRMRRYRLRRRFRRDGAPEWLLEAAERMGVRPLLEEYLAG